MSEFDTLLKHLESLESRSRPVADVIRDLDAYHQDHAAALPPRLAHFLERRSYGKATAFLRGDAENMPPGGCSSKS
ncbi:hypothetical protein [Cerasicoccus arenae]|uniref:Uncharacterized protein n=1 Tax=Cerasicoccus arenae TaxID=424488 RepID=A0A8J3DAS8_9BACT|nr:hypothetical protein [Cerasicoccus arenae]MBK1859148.1 hypothetical protein [Cerasicoccus arenae]GHB98135.1 hypothetical protein GCM10007047_12650 [Cerasicoccus arenae]